MTSPTPVSLKDRIKEQQLFNYTVFSNLALDVSEIQHSRLDWKDVHSSNVQLCTFLQIVSSVSHRRH